MSDERPENLSTKLLEEIVRREFERRGGGGDDGDGTQLEARLAGVEQRTQEMQQQLTRLEGKVDRIQSWAEQMPKAADFFELKGRVSQLPTIWQMLGIVAAIFGLAFALLRFAGAHP